MLPDANARSINSENVIKLEVKMLKLASIPLLLIISGCAIHDPNDVAGRLGREFDKGEKLMDACEKNEHKCPSYYDFKRKWEAEINNYTAFEVALAKHRARIASGYDM